MFLLPFENLVLRSRLSEKELVSRLKENVEIDRPGREAVRRYVGKVNDDGFEIRRAIAHRNSFLPLITGDIMTDLSGTKIEVKMRVPPFTGIFMLVWLAGVGLACASTVSDWRQGGAFKPSQLILFGMLAFGIGLSVISFKTESARSKRDLKEILDADIEG